MTRCTVCGTTAGPFFARNAGPWRCGPCTEALVDAMACLGCGTLACVCGA